MRPDKTTRNCVGWLRALAVVSLFIGLVVGTCDTPRTGASPTSSGPNPGIARGEWQLETPAAQSHRERNTAEGPDATISIPITFARLDNGEGSVALNAAQVPRGLSRYGLSRRTACGYAALIPLTTLAPSNAVS